MSTVRIEQNPSYPESAAHSWWETLGDEWGQLSMERQEEKSAGDQVRKIVEILSLNGKEKILDVPSGLGRHSIALAELGYSVVGLEYAQRFVDEARRVAESLNVAVNFFQGDMRNLPYEDQAFDVVLCLWSSLGYFDHSDNQKTVNEFGRVLQRGGRLLLDVWNPYAMSAFHSPQHWHRFDDGTYSLSALSFDPNTGSYKETICFIRGDAIHEKRITVRLYTPPELKVIFEKAGFKVVATTSAIGGKPATVRSERWYWLLERQ